VLFALSDLEPTFHS